MRYLLLALLLTSCATLERSANRHLKLAERHIAKAKMKGAVIEADTVYVDVITKETVTDTIFVLNDVDRIFRDTITIETNRWKTRTRIDTVTKKIYQQVECKSDTIRIPVKVETKLSPDKTAHWQKYLIGFVAGVVLLLIAFAFRR